MNKHTRARAPLARATIALLPLLVLLTGATAAGAAGPGPIRPGEKLTYSIEYGIIKAGTAELTTERDADDSTLVFSTQARTNSFFDVFFKVRDRVVSRVDPKGFVSLRFEKSLREGKYEDDEMVIFDRERMVAVYDDGKETPLAPDARDVLAAFFDLRTRRLVIGAEIPLVYHSSKKNWPITVKVHNVETVKTPAGEFRCIRIEPRLKSVGVFKQTGRLQIWITADSRRMPVKLESKVVFGAFEAVLTDYR
ncbi:MAG: DUF3108 domain-containing protein [Candidatus Eisenbacteria bacterium]|nr:DUF3108 domain-containing protein [Candidatus Eisenbacteria bacterium]